MKDLPVKPVKRVSCVLKKDVMKSVDVLTIEEVLKKILQEEKKYYDKVIMQATYVERQLDNFFKLFLGG